MKHINLKNIIIPNEDRTYLNNLTNSIKLDKNVNELVKQNLGIIYNAAYYYAKLFSFDNKDVLQQAIICACTIAHKTDEKKGKFSTFFAHYFHYDMIYYFNKYQSGIVDKQYKNKEKKWQGKEIETATEVITDTSKFEIGQKSEEITEFENKDEYEQLCKKIMNNLNDFDKELFKKKYIENKENTEIFAEKVYKQHNINYLHKKIRKIFKKK